MNICMAVSSVGVSGYVCNLVIILGMIDDSSER